MNLNKINWGKLAIFLFIVVMPAVAVGISNWYAFRDSFVIATILLIITVGVAGVTTYFSGSAMAKIRQYCLIFDVIICIVLCINLTSHFLLAREVAAAKTATENRHIEEERRAAFKKAENEQAQRLLEQQAELVAQQKEALRMEAIRNDSARKAGVKPPVAPAPLVPVQVAPIVEATPTPDALRTDLNAIEDARKPSDKPLTEEEVKKSWNPTLTFWAFVDVFVAVLGGAILSAIWQWDRNGNGIDDDEEQGTTLALTPAQTEQLIKLLGPGSKPGPGFQPPVKAEKSRD